MNYDMKVNNYASETFSVNAIVWYHLIASILFGFYLSLLFVKKWSFTFNPSLFWCVTIAGMLLLFSYPILTTFASFDSLPEILNNIRLPFWLLQMSATNLLGIVVGMTLILSCFSAQSNNENH